MKFRMDARQQLLFGEVVMVRFYLVVGDVDPEPLSRRLCPAYRGSASHLHVPRTAARFASPRFLTMLADAERDAQDELEDFP
jgi:hypothetical protein